MLWLDCTIAQAHQSIESYARSKESGEIVQRQIKGDAARPSLSSNSSRYANNKGSWELI